MNSSRRDFLKKAGLGSLGMVGYGLLAGCNSPEEAEATLQNIHEQANKDYSQQYNMHGFAAPALEQIRVGAVGLGSRGSGNMRRFAQMEGVKSAHCVIWSPSMPKKPLHPLVNIHKPGL